MTGVDEGKELGKGSVQVGITTLLISTVFGLLTLLFAWYNGFFNKYEVAVSTGAYSVYSELMLNNPIPVRSIYTTLQKAEEKDFYFIFIEMDGSTVAYTNNSTSYGLSDADRDLFKETVQQQFGREIRFDVTPSQEEDVVDKTLATLHPYTDKMCEVYYNEAHQDSENYYPPYLYIKVLTNKLAGNQ